MFVYKNIIDLFELGSTNFFKTSSDMWVSPFVQRVIQSLTTNVPPPVHEIVKFIDYTTIPSVTMWKHCDYLCTVYVNLYLAFNLNTSHPLLQESSIARPGWPSTPWTSPCRATSPPPSTARRTVCPPLPSSGTRTGTLCALLPQRTAYSCLQAHCSSCAWCTGARSLTRGCTGAWRATPREWPGARTQRCK